MCVAVLLVVVSVYQIMGIQEFNAKLEQLSDHDIARTNALHEVSIAQGLLNSQQNTYQQAVTQKTATAAQKSQIQAHSNNLKSKLQTYATLAEPDKTDLPGQSLSQLQTASQKVITLTAEITAQSTLPSKATQAELDTAQATLTQSISSLASADRQLIQAKNTKSIQLANDRQFSAGILAILFSIMSGILGLVVASRISRSIRQLSRGAERIANGDFSQSIDTSSRDEIGQAGAAFNRMAERLRESYGRIALEQQRDEAILKGMGEGLIAIDAQGKIVIANQVAAELLELGDEASLITQPIQDAFPLYALNAKKDAKLPASKRPGSIALKTGMQVEDVFAFHTKMGTKRQINIAASPVKLDGKVVGVVTILRDVTKEKEVDRMKTEFISLASHQLRTPLSAIKWFSEMLLNGDAGKLKTEQLEFTKNIAESTERMIALVSSLLNISRIESGRIMIVPEPTDLKELVGGIVNDLKAKTEEKQQNLIISIHADLPKIKLDPRLIGQVYLNLLTNAVKYTQKGGEISVFISKKDDMVISQVTDNGYGIPKDQQGRMFQKFFRAANAVKVETDGTGLGLYLIKAVIESSGGKIWFESEENKGTTFWFTIPLSGMKPKEGEVTLDI